MKYSKSLNTKKSNLLRLLRHKENEIKVVEPQGDVEQRVDVH